jgi:NADH:ubiquinone oxidoreductase subunit 2 (subunit N)
MNLYQDLIGISPVVAVSLTALVVVLIEALLRKSENVSFWISVFGLLVSGYLAVYTYPMYSTAFNGMMAVGGYASFFDFVFVIGALLTIFTVKGLPRQKKGQLRRVLCDNFICHIRDDVPCIWT